jgi:AcrR family transcriptional regulator
MDLVDLVRFQRGLDLVDGLGARSIVKTRFRADGSFRDGGQSVSGLGAAAAGTMVRSAAQLIRRKGVSGTGMREIVSEADAPRGSLQHYFPGGKEELVFDALLWMGDVAARRIKQCLSELKSRTPSALLASIVDIRRHDLSNEQFSAGCPLVAAAADTAATSKQLRQVLRRAFDGWLEPLSESLVDLGVPLERSDNLAIVVIAALKGGYHLGQDQTRLDPLDALVLELGPLLEAVARPAVPPSRRTRKRIVSEVEENVMLRRRGKGRFGGEAGWRA